jgi:hypothetical protein
MKASTGKQLAVFDKNGNKVGHVNTHAEAHQKLGLAAAPKPSVVLPVKTPFAAPSPKVSGHIGTAQLETMSKPDLAAHLGQTISKEGSKSPYALHVLDMLRKKDKSDVTEAKKNNPGIFDPNGGRKLGYAVKNSNAEETSINGPTKLPAGEKKWTVYDNKGNFVGKSDQLVGAHRLFKTTEPPKPKRSAIDTAPQTEHELVGDLTLKKAGETFANGEKVPGTGSGGGQWYEDPWTGHAYFLKGYKSDENSMNEVAGALAYQQAGIPTQKVTLVKMNDGTVRALSHYVPNLKPITPSSITPTQQAQARQGFGMDALMSHYDVFGLPSDASGRNLFQDDKGNVVRLDLGGTGKFRAQGAPKSTPEWSPGDWAANPAKASFETMRTSEQGKIAYGSPSAAYVQPSLDKAANFNLIKYHQAMLNAGVSKSFADQQVAVLHARQEYLKGNLPAEVPKKLSEPKPTSIEAPKPQMSASAFAAAHLPKYALGKTIAIKDDNGQVIGYQVILPSPMKKYTGHQYAVFDVNGKKMGHASTTEGVKATLKGQKEAPSPFKSPKAAKGSVAAPGSLHGMTTDANIRSGQRNRMTPAQRSAWDKYTDGLYHSMNKAHAKQDPLGSYGATSKSEMDDLQRHNAQLLAAFDTAGFKVSEPTYTHRGTGSFSYKAKVGDILHNTSFMSTSTSQQKAQGFSYGTPVIKVNLPVGQKFLLGTAFEHEIILPPGMKMRVLNVNALGQVTEVQAVL